MKTYLEWEDYRSKTFYVAWTPHQRGDGVVAISITDQEEAIRLATKATPLNVQVIPEEPMDYQRIQKFLDDLSEWEAKGVTFKFLHGSGVDPRRFSTL